MIKKFNDFNINDIKNNDIKYFERELNSRKKMREDMDTDNDYSFDDIKDFITTEIIEGENYSISTGKKTTNLRKSKNEEIHIEYQSEQMGRVKIFKPFDDSNKGYFEVNGKMHETNADDVRVFYHYLIQQIKQEKVLESVDTNPFKNTMVSASYDDWVGLYVDGKLIEQGHSINWYRLLEILINMGINLSNYKIKRFPKDLSEEDGDILGYSLPGTLKELYEKLNIEY